MDDLISRQAAIDGKISIQRANGVEIYTDEAVPVEHLKNVPAANVVPVRYGQWMSVPEMWGIFSSRYYCSKCGNDAIINSHERYVLSDFCPHCGARMIYGERKE